MPRRRGSSTESDTDSGDEDYVASKASSSGAAARRSSGRARAPTARARGNVSPLPLADPSSGGLETSMTAQYAADVSPAPRRMLPVKAVDKGKARAPRAKRSTEAPVWCYLCSMGMSRASSSSMSERHCFYRGGAHKAREHFAKCHCDPNKRSVGIENTLWGGDIYKRSVWRRVKLGEPIMLQNDVTVCGGMRLDEKGEQWLPCERNPETTNVARDHTACTHWIENVAHQLWGPDFFNQEEPAALAWPEGVHGPRGPPRFHELYASMAGLDVHHMAPVAASLPSMPPAPTLRQPSPPGSAPSHMLPPHAPPTATYSSQLWSRDHHGPPMHHGYASQGQMVHAPTGSHAPPPPPPMHSSYGPAMHGPWSTQVMPGARGQISVADLMPIQEVGPFEEMMMAAKRLREAGEAPTVASSYASLQSYAHAGMKRGVDTINEEGGMGRSMKRVHTHAVPPTGAPAGGLTWAPDIAAPSHSLAMALAGVQRHAWPAPAPHEGAGAVLPGITYSARLHAAAYSISPATATDVLMSELAPHRSSVAVSTSAYPHTHTPSHAPVDTAYARIPM